MTADRLDGIGHDGLPRIGSVAIGYVDVVPNWVVRVRPGVVRCLESQRGDVTAEQRSPAARRRSAQVHPRVRTADPASGHVSQRGELVLWDTDSAAYRAADRPRLLAGGTESSAHCPL